MESSSSRKITSDTSLPHTGHTQCALPTFRALSRSHCSHSILVIFCDTCILLMLSAPDHPRSPATAWPRVCGNTRCLCCTIGAGKWRNLWPVPATLAFWVVAFFIYPCSGGGVVIGIVFSAVSNRSPGFVFHNLLFIFRLIGAENNTPRFAP